MAGGKIVGRWQSEHNQRSLNRTSTCLEIGICDRFFRTISPSRATMPNDWAAERPVKRGAAASASNSPLVRSSRVLDLAITGSLAQ